MSMGPSTWFWCLREASTKNLGVAPLRATPFQCSPAGLGAPALKESSITPVYFVPEVVESFELGLELEF